MENRVMVKSNTNSTVVINIPELALHRTWKKRGQLYPFERQTLITAYYQPSVEYLFKHGILSTDDKEFLVTVGLLNDETEESTQLLLDDKLCNRIIKLMPLSECKATLKKLSIEQIRDLVDYAIYHYTDLQMDRIDLLSKISGKDILKNITNYKAGMEG